MSENLFSVIIPTLNEEKYISGILDDLSVQKYKKFEVTVVDGNSDDKTKEIALNYKKRLPDLKILNARKRNVSFQRNKGAQKSSGKYFLFIDADTRIDKFFLRDIKNKLEKSPADAFSTWINSENQKFGYRSFCFAVSFFYWLFSKLGMPSSPGCFLGFKKEVFTKLKGFSEKIEFAEDRDLVRRCFRKGYSFRYFLNPKYSMSLRRIERIGIIKYLYVFVLVNIKRDLNIKIDRKKEYPMGGTDN